MDEPVELTVTTARDRFSDLINRATYGGEVTWITRGRGHRRVAAIAPAHLAERLAADTKQGE